MSSPPSACSTLHGSPSSREHTCDPGRGILSHDACFTIDPGQILGHEPGLMEPGLMEMSEVEYTHLQHLIQVHMEAQTAPPDAPASRSHPASSIAPAQAVDLSISTDQHCLAMPGEMTPTSHREVPGYVLARIRAAESPTELRADCSASSQMRSRSAARVCLEKRFNSLSADAPRQQDIQSAVHSNFLTMVQQSAEAQEAAIHSQMYKWIKTDRAEFSGLYAANMCEQVIGHNPHMVEPYKHQGLTMPSGFSFKFHPERFVKKAHSASGGNSTEEQQLVNIGSDDAVKPAAFRTHGGTRGSKCSKAASAGRTSAGQSGSGTWIRPQSHMSLIQRKEKHNRKERERRKRISLYCNELNMLVPFCESSTDKVTTLQWTAAFLGYIKKTCGDAFKEGFQTAFAEGKGRFLESSSSSSPDPIHREMDEILSIPLAVEQ
ncbi:transcription factor-like 5 protein [Pseudoliparis swirei]|uniref:transcription factor-like 5 protein n=1 Tax=Pseudoliparis swirei TaxID=2059687 RepID=UPI0024BDDA9C|nr:transcription factor-like 5 protein [Pseudoliparis swirei]